MQIGACGVKLLPSRSILEQEIPCIHSRVISFELVCILETLLKELLYLQKYKFFSIVFFRKWTFRNLSVIFAVRLHPLLQKTLCSSSSYPSEETGRGTRSFCFGPGLCKDKQCDIPVKHPRGVS